MFFKYLGLVFFLTCTDATWGRGGVGSHAQRARWLLQNGYPFSAIALAKEFLATFPGTGEVRRFEGTLQQLIARVGVKQFETLPDRILAQSRAPIIRYIRGKKLFHRGRYQQALAALRGIDGSSSIGPFAHMLQASIYAITGKEARAISFFEQCIDNAASKANSVASGLRQRQYQVTRDYCIVGKARALFGAKRYEEATSAYLDLDKKSFIWPEILFEEAWSSFFQRDYNRTLGKLVTYQAPVFQNFFIPEIAILEALAYMELCLWADAKKAVDLFYQKYLQASGELGSFLRQKGRDYQYFYRAARERKRGRVAGGWLYNKLLRSIIFEPGYQELNLTMRGARRELARVQAWSGSRANMVALGGLKDTLELQRRLMGSYVRKQVIIKYALLRKALTQMSYIKLEVLKRNKAVLYLKQSDQRKRGDIRYLRRNEKQYFWHFNGEFWADELGDYVFALPRKCRK